MVRDEHRQREHGAEMKQLAGEEDRDLSRAVADIDHVRQAPFEEIDEILDEHRV
ncbi:hypothetical protein D3C83_205290 [compost metagenome]